MKTKHLLFSTVIFGLLAGGWGLSFLQSNSGASDEAVYEPRVQKQSLSDGMMEYLQALKADPTTGKIDPDDVLKAKKEVAAAANRKASLNLDWIEMGPDNVGGRTRALLIDKTDSTKIWAGGISGGLWYSEDEGGLWKLYNDDFSNINVSSIAQTDDGRIFIGTGATFESPNGTGGSGFLGAGIYEVTGNGNIQPVSSTVPSQIPNNSNCDFCYVNQMVADGNRLYAATGDGLKVSDDYGASWVNPVYLNGSSGPLNTGTCLDVDVASDGTVLASFSGKIYISPNGNDKTFSAPHLFSGGTRVEVDIAPTDDNIVYASVIAGNNCLLNIYQSSDKGQTWDVIGPGGSGSFDPFSNPGVNCQGGYDNAIAVFPHDAGKILVGGVHLWQWEQTQSNPPAGQWTQIATTIDFGVGGSAYYVHADKHRFKFRDSSTVYIGSDGGVGKSTDGAETFTENNREYNVTQFYSVAFGSQGLAMGGTQDNGTQMLGLHKYNVPGVNTPKSGFEIRGGDGFDCDISQMTPFAFSTVYNGALARHDFTDQSTATFWSTEIEDICQNGCGPFHTVIRLWESFYDPNTQDSVKFFADQSYPSGQTITYTSATNDLPLQHTLTQPLAKGDSILLPDYVQSKFVQANVSSSSSGPIYMTKDAVKTGVQPEWFQIAGSNSQPDAYGGVAYCTEFSGDGNHLFVGQSGGNLYRISNLSFVKDSVTGDARSNGCVVTCELISKNANSLPSRTITGVAVDPNNPDNVIVTLGNYGASNYVYRCSNATSASPDFYPIQGASGNRLPSMPVYDAVIDVNDEDNVIIGTEFGVWATDNAFSASVGSQVAWTEENKNMSHVPVHEIRQQTLPYYMASNTQELYIGTHGRGIWRTTSLVDIKPRDEEETRFDTDLNVYPNPMSQNGFVEFNLNENTSDARLMVYDISGKLVIDRKLSQRYKGKNKAKLNVSSLRRGTYIIKLQAGKDSDVAKFIVN